MRERPPETADEAIAPTSEEWINWGARDPMWGVATLAGREIGSANPWTATDFYSSGRSEWQDYRAAWRRFGMPAGGRVLEVGCGAGRITACLAADFREVHALDVSPGMLEFATRHVTAPNIRWQVYGGRRFQLADASVDGVFTCHVLQHLASVEAVCACLAEIQRVLRPGGSVLAHVEGHCWPHLHRSFTSGTDWLYRGYLLAYAIRARIRRARMRRGGRPYMHSVSLEQHALMDQLRRMGWADYMLLTIPVGQAAKPHTCILAER